MNNLKITTLVVMFALLATSLLSQDLEPAPQEIQDAYTQSQDAYETFNDGKLVKLPQEMMVNVMANNSKVGINNSKELKTNDCGNISFIPEDVRRCEPRGSFIVNYSGFTPEAQDAFQYAVDIWSSVLNLPVPVVINASFTALGPGVLGSAGPTFINRDGANYPLSGHWYPIALSNQFDGVDVVAGNAHINANFSSGFANWYFGLDGCPPAGDFDFVTVVLHEIGHGLGFLTSRTVMPGGIGCFGLGGFPWAFDSFLTNSAFGLTLSDINTLFGNGCFFGLGNFYTNDMLFFNGPETVACFGAPPRMYAPSVFAPGSSTSHFDEATFPGVDPDGGLMTPFVAPGQAIHDPGCTLALLSDLGYGALSEVPTCIVPVPTMGEWGLMSLGLLLLILGVVTIKSRQLVTA